MINLLGNVYLDYHERLTYCDDFIEILENTGDYVDYNDLMVKDMRGKRVERILVCDSLDHLEHFYGDFQRMFAFFCSRKDDLYIYADPKFFNDILIKYWKTFLIKLSPDKAYGLYKIYRNSGIFKPFQNFYRKKNIENTQQLNDLYFYLNKDEFIEKYNSISSFNLDHYSFRDYLPFEFSLATVLRNPKDNISSNFYRILEGIYKKSLIREIYDNKCDMEIIVYALNRYLPNLPEHNFDDFNFEDMLKVYPELSILGNNESYSLNVDIFSKDSSIDIKKLLKIVSVIDDDQRGKHKYLRSSFVLNNYKPMTGEEIIEHDLNILNSKRLPQDMIIYDYLGEIHSNPSLVLKLMYMRLEGSKLQDLDPYCIWKR